MIYGPNYIPFNLVSFVAFVVFSFCVGYFGSAFWMLIESDNALADELQIEQANFVEPEN